MGATVGAAVVVAVTGANWDVGACGSSLRQPTAAAATATQARNTKHGRFREVMRGKSPRAWARGRSIRYGNKLPRTAARAGRELDGTPRPP